MIFFRSKSLVFFISCFFISVLIILLSTQNAFCNTKRKQKIGILYSYENAKSYGEANNETFDGEWGNFTKSFQKTFLEPEFICCIGKDTKLDALDVSIILFPVAMNIDEGEEDFLNRFLENGGKLIISPGEGEISERLKSFLLNNGVLVEGINIAGETLALQHRASNVSGELPLGSTFFDFEVQGLLANVAAKWKETNHNAIAASENLVFFGYKWGKDLDLEQDVKILYSTLDYYWNNSTSKIEIAISKEEFKKSFDEIIRLKERASSVIDIAEELNLSVPKYELTRHLQTGINHVRDFSSNYLFGNYLKARESEKLAISEFSIVSSLGLPEKSVEIRAVWLDRGTIVNCQGETELRGIIKKLANAGFNTIFFETLNAGYPIYPSEITPQNPQVKNWDPLKIAIDEAHLNNIELHAWVWTFAQGNIKHNLLVGEYKEYPGPIISNDKSSWALTTKDGKMRIDGQPETWISPANKEATDFLIKLFSEIISNYDVDGIQLDYIRFPFQKRSSQVGFDDVTRNLFLSETGKMPDLNGHVNKIWKDWKTKKVSMFVQEANTELKKINPDLKFSVAVFAIPRKKRIDIIQQDWETWAQNKWVDAVYPFYYSYSPEATLKKLEESRAEIYDKALLIPAFNLKVINEGGLSERIIASRNAGSLGIALFAAAHLDRNKAEILVKGPFRKKTHLIPYNDSMKACSMLFTDFANLVDIFTNTKSCNVLSDKKTKEEIKILTEDLKKEFKEYKPERNEQIQNKLNQLSMKMQEWLRFEKYLGRDERTTYIKSSLEQVKALFSYSTN